MTTHRVIVVEDNDTTAQFVRQQLIDGGLFPEVVRSGLEALRKAHAQTFALAIIDVDIASEPDGVETADWLKNLYGIPVVVFSMRIDSEIRKNAPVAVTAGYLIRPEAGELSGVVSARLKPVVADKQSAVPPGFADLSGREWQIILDLIEKPSAKAVAAKRQRSPHTVHNHLKSIFRKLQVHSVADLLSLMLRISRQVPIV